MKKSLISILAVLFASSFFVAASDAPAAEYEALKHIKMVQAIFDFRIGDPKTAASQMNLIHDTYRDLALTRKKPVFVVVFMGPSVKLLSKDTAGFSPDSQKNLDEIAGAISAMSRNGIKFEICLIAAEAFKVDPSAVLKEIAKVENGLISEIGYQVQGYSLVPVF